MKAKLRALFVLLALCIFFALNLALLPSERPVPAALVTGIMITNIPVSEVFALAITNSYGLFGILNSPEGITVLADLDGNFNAQEMRALIYLTANLPGLRRLDNFSPPEADGIANSLARFTLILNGGMESNFTILQQSPVSDDYLLFFEEQGSLFLISRSTAEWFLRDPEDYLVP